MVIFIYIEENDIYIIYHISFPYDSVGHITRITSTDSTYAILGTNFVPEVCFRILYQLHYIISLHRQNCIQFKLDFMQLSSNKRSCFGLFQQVGSFAHCSKNVFLPEEVPWQFFNSDLKVYLKKGMYFLYAFTVQTVLLLVFYHIMSNHLR